MKAETDYAPCALTIAGSDSGGNAGVQADLRAFHAYGVHGCTVFAALTAQNPFGVTGIHAVPEEFVAKQLDAVLGVYAIRALKTGMLAEPGIIETVADRLASHPEIAKVIDPVMVATSGAKLISDDAIDTLKKRLLPLARLATPNIPEARVLANDEAQALSQIDLARKIAAEYGIAVLVKGGHSEGGEAVDILSDANGSIREYVSPRIMNPISTHGTGCSLAAALAAELAIARGLADAVAGAKRYVHRAIASSHLVGKDCGVLGFVEDAAK